VQLLPALGDALLYDRTAILRGEAWRFVTGHWVHYSWAHLWGNAAVIAVAGCWAERRGSSGVVRLLAFASLAIGGALWVFEPGILQFAGASGLAVALTVYAAARAWQDGGRSRWAGGVVLAGVAAKLLAESAGWQWRDASADGFVLVSMSHGAGAAVALLFAVVTGRRSAAGGDEADYGSAAL